MFRCSLALALLGATTHAFQAPRRLSATWSASSHLSTSQARLARTTITKAATELKSTKMNYASYRQPMNQRELRLMNQRVRLVPSRDRHLAAATAAAAALVLSLSASFVASQVVSFIGRRRASRSRSQAAGHRGRVGRRLTVPPVVSMLLLPCSCARPRPNPSHTLAHPSPPLFLPRPRRALVRSSAAPSRRRPAPPASLGTTITRTATTPKCTTMGTMG